MFRQHGIHKHHIDPKEDWNDAQKTHPQKSTHPQERSLSSWIFLLILLIFGGVGIGLEKAGITNVIQSFGKGGRPVVTFGVWHFADVSEDFWARPMIEGLIQEQAISGYADDTFRPNQAITRAEFAAMLHAAFDERTLQESIKFKDIPPEFWGASAITNVTEAGFFKGYPQGTFRPAQTLSRVNAFVALAEGLDLNTDNLRGKTVDQILSTYDDAEQIPGYAKDAVAAAIAAGLVAQGPSTTDLNPNHPMTRAEAAALVYQALFRQSIVNQ